MGRTRLEPTPENIAKLPKWAQSEIKLLKANYKYLEERYNSLAGEIKTNIEINYFALDTDKIIYLDDDANVKFTFADGEHVHVSFGYENMRTIQILGKNALAVLPGSSNLVEIGMLDWECKLRERREYRAKTKEKKKGSS